MILEPLSKLKLDYTDLTTNIKLLKRVRVLKKSNNVAVKQRAKQCLGQWREVLNRSGPIIAAPGGSGSAGASDIPSSSAGSSGGNASARSHTEAGAGRATAAATSSPQSHKKHKVAVSSNGSGGSSSSTAPRSQSQSTAKAATAQASLKRPLATGVPPPIAPTAPTAPTAYSSEVLKGGNGASYASMQPATGPPIRAKTSSLHAVVKQSDEFTCPKCM